MAVVKTLTKNLSYFGQQFSALLGNTSPLVKFICVVVFFGYFLSYSSEVVKFLSVTPGYLLPPAFWIWTAFTYCFLEIHFWEVCVDLITVGLCGKLIEPLWGQLEMSLYFMVVNLGVAVLSTFYYHVLYACTFDTSVLFDVHIHGLAGYIAGLSVAVKQIMPDHILLKTPLGKMTNRNIPLSIVFLSIVLYLCGLLEGTNPTMFVSGLLVSWTYLRFYQRHTNGTRGDMSDSFTFSSFFPNVIQPGISVVCNSIHSGLVRIGLCPRAVRKFDLAATPSPLSVSLPSDPHDMERRRQMALKALSERLNKNEGSSKSGSSKSSKKHHAPPPIVIPMAPLISNTIPTNTAPGTPHSNSTNHAATGNTSSNPSQSTTLLIDT